MKKQLLRQLPQIDSALSWPELASLIALHSRVEVSRALRKVLDELRSTVLRGPADVGNSDDAGNSADAEDAEDAADASEIFSSRSISQSVGRILGESKVSSYRRVINGTGILLHTGLGRAVLPESAMDTVQNNLRGYSLVEIDATSGQRNQREGPLRELITELTGAASSTVVNNNAAATLLILAAFARGKEVIISRGQLVEIGGSFRIPDIFEESGAKLVEVGTTNRTYLRDYERAITEDTGLLLDVHTSNYDIRGFTHSASLTELVALGKERGIPVVSDLGSGCFLDLSPYGFRPEPLVSDTVNAGPDLVCFSGDKLLGGPQAGIILGSEEAISRVRDHQLFRCLRVDKVTLSLLEATLHIYRNPDRALRDIPALACLSMPAPAVRARAENFAQKLKSAPDQQLEVEVVETQSEMGSGSLPAQDIPSHALSLRHAHSSVEQLAQALRSASPPVLTRKHDGRLLIDFRTLLPNDESDLERVLAEVGGQSPLDHEQ